MLLAGRGGEEGSSGSSGSRVSIGLALGTREEHSVGQRTALCTLERLCRERGTGKPKDGSRGKLP